MYDLNHNDTLFEFERRNDIESCISFDLKSMADNCSLLDKLVDTTFENAQLHSLIKAKGSKTFANATRRLKNDLRCILWHLYEAHVRFNDCFVRIPLQTSAYGKDATRNPHSISRDVRTILHRLDDCGMIECHKGFLDRSRHYGKTTRIRVRGPLLEHIRLLPKDIQEALTTPKSIEFRLSGDKDKLPVELCIIDTSLRDAEVLLDEYNQVISATSITLEDFNLTQLSKKTYLQRKTLKAIYHIEANGTFSYGRMHGAFWQVIPKDMRHHIRIENCPTVELDYSAQALNIIASLSGVQLHGDGYDIDVGLSQFGFDFQRDFVKSLIVIMLNSKSFDSFSKAIRQKYRLEQAFNIAKLKLTNNFLKSCVTNVVIKHPFIRPYICSGLGKAIFLIDSDIARVIISSSLDEGLVILPIHDGFICKCSDEHKLRTIMTNVWLERFGTTIPIKREF